MRRDIRKGQVINLANVSFTYGTAWKAGFPALRGVTLNAAPGEVLGIAGANGAGKTTLLSLLLGFIRPSEGVVTLDGLEPRQFVERDQLCFSNGRRTQH